MSQRPERLRQLFEDAFRLPESERNAFLRLKCGSDWELLREIESLLSQANSTSTTITGLRLAENLETIATIAHEKSTESSTVATQSQDDQFGPYAILKLIGEGGMGTVYLVEQTQPIRRRVALKVVKLGMDTRQVIARFESERQALAMMEHPHIAQIYDAGTSAKGRPYFVMEYVPGLAITQYCDEQVLDVRERLKIFVTVCQAFQHAHQKGVIHRDIKPSNILVFEQDGKPFPKVIDFGIAKATDQHAAEQSAFTQVGSLMGTPEYMSPEQANLTNPNVDTATDVYSLGVLLYELLAGALPFEGRVLRQAGLAELLRIIREEVPPTPSARITELGQAATEVARSRRTDPPTLRRQLTGDLNWIVMKALEKDRSRRYASMSELAADIQRHLSDQSVLAGAPSTLYRARKFARRHRISVAAGLLVATSLVAGMISTGWQAHVAEEERRRAEDGRQLAQAQKAQALRILEWVVAETVHFPPNESDVKYLRDEGQAIVRGLITKLDALGFRGQMVIEGHRGIFCLDPAAYAKGVIKLAPDKLPLEKCAYNFDEYNLAAGDSSASSMKELIATLPRPPGIEIRTISYGEERPLGGIPTYRDSRRIQSRRAGKKRHPHCLDGSCPGR